MNQRGSLENGDGCYSKRNYKCQMTEKSSIPHDPKFNTKNDYLYQDQIGEYFEKSIGNTVEKLENFCKYVPDKVYRSLAKYEIYKEILDVPGHILELSIIWWRIDDLAPTGNNIRTDKLCKENYRLTLFWLSVNSRGR